jgi:lipopolysaccharide heptosyltransferase II
MSMAQQRWDQAHNILCIRLDYLGDVLMTTPALRALAQQPGRRLTLLSSAAGASAAPFLPELNDAIVYAAPWMKHGGADASLDLTMIEALRARRFDAAVIFTVYSQNPLPAAMLCYLAGIPLRLAHCRENPYHLLTHWVPETEPAQQLRHEVRRQLDLVASVGATAVDERLSFCVPPQAVHQLRESLQSMGIVPGRPYVVLHTGASAPSRRYPDLHWRAVARGLSTRLACPLLFTGTEPEGSMVEQIRRDIPHTHNLAGALDLGGLGALIAGAALLISNNTGPVHLAAALGTPVVDLYALTNPQHTPWQVASRVLFNDVACRYCYKSVCPEQHHACLTGVAPQQVVNAALELLGVAAPSEIAPLPRLSAGRPRFIPPSID